MSENLIHHGRFKRHAGRRLPGAPKSVLEVPQCRKFFPARRACSRVCFDLH